MELKPPEYLPRRLADGTWNIEVTWPSGRVETVGPYPSAEVAEKEIKVRLDAWIDGYTKFEKR